MQRRPIWQWLVLGLWLGSLVAITAWLIFRSDPEDRSGNGMITNQVAQEPIPPAKALPAAEQLALAFRTAFGANGEVRRSVGEQTYVYQAERLEWLGNRAMLISLGRNVEDCHACGGTMAIHYLSPEGDGLRVSGAWLENPPSGSFGAPPGEIAINRELTDNPIVYATGGSTNQGYTCSVAWLVELRRDGPVTSGPIPISYSNTGAVMEDTGRTMGGDPLRELQGRIANVRRGQSFDVAFTGAEQFTETYSYRGGRFVGPALDSRAAC
jgi:hypothetical protein